MKENTTAISLYKVSRLLSDAPPEGHIAVDFFAIHSLRASSTLCIRMQRFFRFVANITQLRSD
jgi:hypothetical protein